MLGVAFEVQKVEASGTMYIRADGSVDPSDAPVLSSDNVTYLHPTDNMYGEIVVERNNIVIEGAGYSLQGFGSGFGVSWQSVDNVSIQNVARNMVCRT